MKRGRLEQKQPPGEPVIWGGVRWPQLAMGKRRLLCGRERQRVDPDWVSACSYVRDTNPYRPALLRSKTDPSDA
jgi:hypothetical protein